MSAPAVARRPLARHAAVLLLVVLLALAPFTNRNLGGLLPGPINSAGSLQLLALMLVAAATAVTLDLMFGYTGLLSFGHALYFGFGCYSTVVLSNIASLGFAKGVALAMLLTFVVALAGNASSAPAPSPARWPAPAVPCTRWSWAAPTRASWSWATRSRWC